MMEIRREKDCKFPRCSYLHLNNSDYCAGHQSAKNLDKIEQAFVTLDALESDIKGLRRFIMNEAFK